jgi:tetratricopeptide (TPR) repeat protein
MNKQNYLYGVIGLLLGLMIGYIGTDHLNRNAPAAQFQSSGDGLPADHPQTGAGDEAANAGGGAQADVTAAIDKARKEPTNFDAQVKAAELFIQIGRGEQALEFFENAAKVKPNDFNLLATLGNGYFDLKRYDDSAKWYQQAVKVNPKDAAVWLDLGASYYLRQPRDLDKAIAAYRSGLKVDPKHEKSLQNLTRALIDKGDKTAARESLKQLEQNYPGNQSIPQFRTELP